MVFQADYAFGFNGTLHAERLSILGHSITSNGSYIVVMAAFFVLMALALLLLRRGVLGRLLIAMRDSPAACGTLGLDMRWFRVALFGLSAGMAGLAGGLFAGLRGTIGAADFQLFNSLPLLLLAVVCGVTSVTGAAMGGVGLMLLPVLQSSHPEFAGLIFAILGFGAVALGRDPNGLANLLFGLGRRLDRRFGDTVRSVVPVLPLPKPRVEDDALIDPVVEPLSEPVLPLKEVPAHVASRG
jgi:branched-chain amino acid transport system permease protein